MTAVPPSQPLAADPTSVELSAEGGGREHVELSAEGGGREHVELSAEGGGREHVEHDDPDADRIIAEEEGCLERVLDHLRQRRPRPSTRESGNYDERLLELRDQIASARLEDVPPLVQEMERLQLLASRLRETTESTTDIASPYFGRLVLEEEGRQREVLIGRGTHLDTKVGIRIVDWRDAPVSRLYYRCDEGDDYDEVFGEREISGVVRVRRSLSIIDSVLERIAAPQGHFGRRAGGWRRLESSARRLSGGAGSAIRAERHHRPGKLGTGSGSGEDKLLKEITPLIDRRQFELITRGDSGLVVIQGGAGSGKTTIGLHRLAYLAYRDARRFQPDKLLVLVFNEALARYVAGVLPALGVSGVTIRTYEAWAQRLRHALLPKLPSHYRDDTPSLVTRLKKHPALIHAVDDHVKALSAEIDAEIRTALAPAGPAGEPLLAAWDASRGRVLGHRLHGLQARLATATAGLAASVRNALERAVTNGLRTTRDLVQHWAELLGDLPALRRVFERYAPDAFAPAELTRAQAWCSARLSEVIEALAEAEEARAERGRSETGRKTGSDRDRDRDDSDDEDRAPLRRGIDGQELGERARLDLEDDALFLLLYQRLRGPLTRGVGSKEPVVYEHVLIDEAQDLSPLELAVVLGVVSPGQSVTLAGDVQQRLHMENGFSSWQGVLGELDLSHVAVEPLQVSYRSTRQIIDFSRAVLGPLASADAPEATRDGAPVELLRFAHQGDAVAFLAEALRELSSSEPACSVALVARFPEQADAYYAALVRAEIPNLRRIAEQDFPFKPGLDVTDVRQVKGLEFDYVVLLDVNEASYPDDDEARHLLHIGATRAAHQLWVVCAGKPSPLLPSGLFEPD